MYDFQNIPRAKDSDIFVKENYEEAEKDEHETHTHGTSEENGADESTLQLSAQESDGENSIENPLSADSQYERDSQPALKKKRRTNNNKVIVEDANKKSKLSKTPKLKKSKSESKIFSSCQLLINRFIFRQERNLFHHSQGQLFKFENHQAS